jgi:hypothetical protein
MIYEINGKVFALSYVNQAFLWINSLKLELYYNVWLKSPASNSNICK